MELDHVQIHEHEVIVPAGDELDRLDPVAGDVRPVAEPLEHPRQQKLVCKLVLHDQDLQSIARGGWLDRARCGAPRAGRGCAVSAELIASRNPRA